MSDNVTFKDKYKSLVKWQDKAILIALYHSVMCNKYPNWTRNDTALHFGVSLGLVSENIRLAKEIDDGNKKVINAKHREDALKCLDRRRYPSERNGHVLFKDE